MEEYDPFKFGISAYFTELRFNDNHHLGLGDIRLTLAQQEEIIQYCKKLDEKMLQSPKQNHFTQILTKKITECINKKQKIIETHLQEILQCRSWQEIKKYCRVEYHQTNEGPKEIWFFDDKKILTVQQNLMDTSGKISFIYRKHV